MNLLARIKQELRFLPPKDKTLCEKFVEDRKFEELLDIVSSCIVMKTRDNNREAPTEKWKDINLENLVKLRVDVEEYMDYGRISDDDYYDEY